MYFDQICLFWRENSNNARLLAAIRQSYHPENQRKRSPLDFLIHWHYFRWSIRAWYFRKNYSMTHFPFLFQVYSSTWLEKVLSICQRRPRISQTKKITSTSGSDYWENQVNNRSILTNQQRLLTQKGEMVVILMISRFSSSLFYIQQRQAARKLKVTIASNQSENGYNSFRQKTTAVVFAHWEKWLPGVQANQSSYFGIFNQFLYYQ